MRHSRAANFSRTVALSAPLGWAVPAGVRQNVPTQLGKSPVATKVPDCSLSGVLRSCSPWLSPDLVIGHHPEAKEAVVPDRIIKHFAGKPLTAKVDIDNAKRTAFTWVLKGTTTKLNQFADMYYRITIQKSDRRATMSGRALNYAGPYTRNGTCTLTQK
jgi:hypothetical protein